MDASAKGALEAGGLHARKGLGQHFLTNPRILEKLVRAAELSRDDTVVEIGPGLGHLTRLLAERAGQVFAVELDDRLAERLRTLAREESLSNLKVVQRDILEVDLGAVIAGEAGRLPAVTDVRPYKVVANLPYYITSAVLRHVLEGQSRPTRLVVTVQREVAKRIAAKPPAMSLLAVSVQYYAEVKIGGLIPAGAFYPPPKVDSAWIVLDVFPNSPFEGDTEAFFELVRAGFTMPRKQLRNTLAQGLGIPTRQAESLLTESRVDPKRRAETLTLSEWSTVATGWTTRRRGTNPPRG